MSKSTREQEIRERVRDQCVENLEEVLDEHKRRHAYRENVDLNDSGTRDDAASKDKAIRDLKEHVKKFK